MKRIWLIAFLSFPLCEIALAEEDPGWLRLLHYRGGQSEVDSPGFFLSPDGKHKPLAEKEASLTASCKFPARSLYLKPDFDYLSCDEVRAWLDEYSSVDLTLVYAGPFVENPASVFGHTFLRFDRQDRVEAAPLLEKTVSFAADTAGETGFNLAYKGLFGLYEGKFFFGQFDQALNRYRDLDRREIWEFSLNFNEKQKLMILLHLFELKEQHFDYYFIDENCSYHLLSLLEASGLDFKSSLHSYVTPVQTIRVVFDTGIVSEVKKRDSLISTVQSEGLSSDKKRWLIARLEGDIEEERATRAHIQSTIPPAYPTSWQEFLPTRIRLLPGVENENFAVSLSFRLVYSDFLDSPSMKEGELEVLKFESSLTSDGFFLDDFRLLSVSSLPQFDLDLSMFSWSASGGAYRQGGHKNLEASSSFQGGITLGNLSFLTGARANSDNRGVEVSPMLSTLFQTQLFNMLRTRFRADAGRLLIHEESNWFSLTGGLSHGLSKNYGLHLEVERHYERSSGRTQLSAGVAYKY